MVRAEELTSAANPLLKEIRRAIARGGRTREGYCVAESFHLLEEALRGACELGTVIAAESARKAVEKLLKRDTRLVVVPDPLFRSLSDTEAAQGVMALVRPPQWEMAQLFSGQPLVVVLDGVQDPGNVGTIVRAAEAFRASGLVFLKGTASPYNPKAVRASAGSVFRVPLVTGVEQAPARAVLEERGVALYAAAPSAETALDRADLTHACALVVGSEGRGVGSEWMIRATGLRIPTTKVESLNAAMAAGILLYEARRQRTAL